MKKRFLFKAFSILTVVALFLTACGTKDTESKGGEQDVSKPDTPQQVVDNEIEMPTADLSNTSKVLKVYGWSTMAENNTDGEAAAYFKEEFGITIEETIGTHEDYWATLAKMVAAGNAPDVVDMAYDKFFPLPVSSGLIEPWDDLVDFNTPLWASTKDTIDSLKWKGKTYYPVVSEYLHAWVYYNKNMFKEYGLEDMTPRALYERDEWTLDKLLEVSDMFIEKNNRNEITQWGFTPQNMEPLAISGTQLVEIINGESYKNNFKDPKIAKVMNSFYKISKAASGSMSTSDACPLFENEKVAMLMSAATLTLEKRFEHLRQKDALGFAPLPKLDNDSNYNCITSVDPGYGLIKGAKNKEVAALWLNYLKWFKIGDNFCVEIPTAKEDSPAKQRYNIKDKAGSAKLSEEDIEFINKYLASNPTKVYTTYQSIVRNVGDLMDFKYQIFSGASQWSAAVQQLYPIYETALKDYIAN